MTCSSWTGDPDHSYLVEKIEATDAHPPRVGDPMPPPPAPQLPARVIADIRRWIAAGARVRKRTAPSSTPAAATSGGGIRDHLLRAHAARPVRSGSGGDRIGADRPAGEIPAAAHRPTADGPGNRVRDRHHSELGSSATSRSRCVRTASAPSTAAAVRSSSRSRSSRSPSTAPWRSVSRRRSPPERHPAGRLSREGQPLDPVSGTLKLVGVATIPPDSAVVGGDPVLIELEGSIAPVVPAVPRLTDEIQPIFNAGCALANCHVGDGAGGLNLEAGRAFAELVGVPSTQVDDVLVGVGRPGAQLPVREGRFRPAAGGRSHAARQRPRPTGHRGHPPMDRRRRSRMRPRSSSSLEAHGVGVDR